MRAKVLLGIIIGLTVLFLIGWWLYKRFNNKKVENTPPEDIKEKPPPIENKTIPKQEPAKRFKPKLFTSATSATSATKPSIIGASKWNEFKFSKKANEAKLNNDIEISKHNEFDNPDFKEIFDKPYNVEKDLFTSDTVNKVEISKLNKINYDTYLSSKVCDSVDINKLDSVNNFENIFKNIEDQITVNTEEPSKPKITLIDEEVFGY